LNLVVNARDAMPDGGTITITAQEEALKEANSLKLGAGRYVVLSVTDHGMGMDEETMRSATEPFFTTKGPGKGTGLGLPMVLGLAEQSGGRLQLESHPRQGTTASLWFPGEATNPALGAAPTNRSASLPQIEPLDVLVVDDDALVLLNT